MTRILVRIALMLLVAAGMILVLLAFERSFIFFPIREHAATPAEYGLRAEELSIRNDVRLHGWWIRGRGDRVLVYFHGNAGNISHRLDRTRLLVNRFGLDVVLVDYRGYGSSQGSPDEAGLYRDGLATYDAVAARGVDPSRIVMFGESLGCAIALDVAIQRAAAGVILETPFLSVPAMARVHYPFIPARLVRTQFDSASRIPKLRAAVLILHGDRDEIVPFSHAKTLFDLAAQPKRFFTIPGAGHNDTYLVGGEPYFTAWGEFLASLGSSPKTN